MEIRHLQTFITIVEMGSFTKAAERLGYAQPTITAHIQILENEMDTILFDRLGKKIILTSVGKKLVPYAKQMLGIYKEIQSLHTKENEISGDLTIGVSESLTIYRLDHILKEYKRHFPKVNLILKTAKCSELRNKLHTGEVELTLSIEPEILDLDLVVEKLKDERMMMVGAPDSNLEFLAKENLILSESGCLARDAFEDYLKQKKISYINPIELSSIEAIKKCVLNGLGISVMPYYTVSKEINEGKLKMIEMHHPFPQFSTQMAYHRHKNISQAMKQFMEMTLKDASRW
ncbi:MAG: LysR family transcriptional regulator [Cellulosilyticum sp.]|nr:LysR family transcriptional regulator [Cellulosilyticum sp.]